MGSFQNLESLLVQITNILTKYFTYAEIGDDRWRAVSLKLQIFILCYGQRKHVLKYSINITRLFATKNPHFCRKRHFRPFLNEQFLAANFPFAASNCRLV